MYQDDPGPILRSLVRAAQPGGLISILAKNASALSMRPGLQQRWTEARALLGSDRSIGGLGHVTRGDSIASLTELLDHYGAGVIALFGVRIFTDHLGDISSGPDVDDILALELAAGARDPYRQVARLFHLLARRGSVRDPEARR